MESKDTKHVYFENKLFASVVDINNIPDGLSFLTNDDSYIQVGTWNYDKNKLLEAHFHNYFERSSFRTQEVDSFNVFFRNVWFYLVNLF